MGIIGGGIAGLACGLGLIEKGINVRIYEKARYMTPVGAAIGLFPNGLAAAAGISATLHKKAVDASIESKVMQTWSSMDGTLVNEREAGSSSLRYLCWYLLQQFLAEEIPNGLVSFGHTCDDFSVDASTGLTNVKLTD